MSQGVHAEPNSRANLENANYQTALGNEVLTPPVYRYFYDQDAWNILNESQAIWSHKSWKLIISTKIIQH